MKSIISDELSIKDASVKYEIKYPTAKSIVASYLKKQPGDIK